MASPFCPRNFQFSVGSWRTQAPSSGILADVASGPLLKATLDKWIEGMNMDGMPQQGADRAFWESQATAFAFQARVAPEVTPEWLGRRMLELADHHPAGIAHSMISNETPLPPVLSRIAAEYAGLLWDGAMKLLLAHPRQAS